MDNQYIDLPTINEMHRVMQQQTPRHPLVSLVDHSTFYNKRPEGAPVYRFGFYVISCKQFDGILKYGRGSYDFTQGSLMFTAPGQVIATTPGAPAGEGWALFIHPDLLYGTDLGRKIDQYSFFDYQADEALHVSEEEQLILKDCIGKIEKEYLQNIDKHSHGLIVSNIELLLNYCNRFYDRQFYTRTKVNGDIVQRFERLLKAYFKEEAMAESGLPNVGYFASRLNLSPNYLSDLLQKFTGKTTIEHIHLELVAQAKSLLWSTDVSISEIAYRLGFGHPSHFTKLFKTKTGKSPKEFRRLN